LILSCPGLGLEKSSLTLLLQITTTEQSALRLPKGLNSGQYEDETSQQDSVACVLTIASNATGPR